MIVYRLTHPQYANDLSGIGSSIYGGRWNPIGCFMLYTAQSSSLSILEHLVHIKGARNELKYRLNMIELGDSPITELEIDHTDIRNPNKTEEIGSEWILSGSTPVLKVPSVINPLEYNYLINPTHTDLEINIVNQEWFVYDERLVKA